MQQFLPRLTLYKRGSLGCVMWLANSMHDVPVSSCSYIQNKTFKVGVLVNLENKGFYLTSSQNTLCSYLCHISLLILYTKRLCKVAKK